MSSTLERNSKKERKKEFPGSQAFVRGNPENGNEEETKKYARVKKEEK